MFELKLLERLRSICLLALCAPLLFVSITAVAAEDAGKIESELNGLASFLDRRCLLQDRSHPTDAVLRARLPDKDGYWRARKGRSSRRPR